MSQPSFWRDWRSYVQLAVGGLIVVGVGGGILHAALSSDEVTDVCRAYLDEVRARELDAAYLMLHPDARARLTREAFESEMSNPELVTAGAFSLGETHSYGTGRACLTGEIEVDGRDKSIRMYLQESAGELRILDVIVYEGPAVRGPFSCDGV